MGSRVIVQNVEKMRNERRVEMSVEFKVPLNEELVKDALLRMREKVEKGLVRDELAVDEHGNKAYPIGKAAVRWSILGALFSVKYDRLGYYTGLVERREFAGPVLHGSESVNERVWEEMLVRIVKNVERVRTFGETRHTMLSKVEQWDQDETVTTEDVLKVLDEEIANVEVGMVKHLPDMIGGVGVRCKELKGVVPDSPYMRAMRKVK